MEERPRGRSAVLHVSPVKNMWSPGVTLIVHISQTCHEVLCGSTEKRCLEIEVAEDVEATACRNVRPDLRKLSACRKLLHCLQVPVA
jgi:hypothetical protein